jgi:hypothetical protein
MEAPGEASVAMDVEQDESVPSAPSSPPPVPPTSFQELNGGINHDRIIDDRINGDSSPVPPPHRINTFSSPPQPPPPPPPPTIDPEACKSLGNKYFSSKDYKKAIAEYTKGKLNCPSVFIIPYS